MGGIGKLGQAGMAATVLRRAQRYMSTRGKAGGDADGGSGAASPGRRGADAGGVGRDEAAGGVDALVGEAPRLLRQARAKGVSATLRDAQAVFGGKRPDGAPGG